MHITLIIHYRASSQKSAAALQKTAKTIASSGGKWQISLILL